MKDKILIPFAILIISSSFSQNIQTTELNDTRSYEVTATVLPDNSIIAVWMEARPEREVSSQVGNVRIAYKVSNDFGETWSNKEIIDDLERFTLGNPYVLTDEKGNTYLTFMKVNNDFFSGNIAFYKWDNDTGKFLLKSIPVTSENTLLDKPALARVKDRIYLSYIEYTEKLEKSHVTYQFSDDNGEIWSPPHRITDDGIIYLGVSMKRIDENLHLSYGTYWQQKIYHSEGINGENDSLFRKKEAIAEISDTLGAALTELSVDKNGNIAIGWFYNHEPKEVYISVRSQESDVFTNPLLLSKSGNLLALSFDDANNILCLYSEFENDLFSVVVKKVSVDKPQEQQEIFYLKEPSKINARRDYIGAFQKIIKTQNDEVLAFWIDYSNENKLYYSRWHDR